MTEPHVQARATSPGGLDGLARAVLLATAVGPAAAVGTAAAVAMVYAYYNDPWRPLAHVLAPWAVLAVAVAFRRPLLPAVAAGVASLAAAVVTFYVGLKVGHDIRWADSGSVMGIDWDRIRLWLVLACLAGGVFGLLGATAARRDWRGAAATAALLGLLLGEAYRRSADWGRRGGRVRRGRGRAGVRRGDPGQPPSAAHPGPDRRRRSDRPGGGLRSGPPRTTAGRRPLAVATKDVVDSRRGGLIAKETSGRSGGA